MRLQIIISNFFMHVSSDGKEHALYARDGIIETPMSTEITGEDWNCETERYAGFWRYLMSNDTVYIGLKYSKSERKIISRVIGALRSGFVTQNECLPLDRWVTNGTPSPPQTTYLQTYYN